jgi:probable addiction module antidote protein
MIKAGISHEKNLIEWLKKSPDNQREYLKASIEENSDMPEAILMAIREIAEARGFEVLAKEAGLSQKSLYKILSEDKNAKPRFETISQIVHALGLRITVEPIDKEEAS